jgi:phage-related minor tail protein
MDLIAASMQEVAPGLRDELGEATTEYSKFFADLGFTGEETFALLAAADDKFSLDKTGDAIKELSIRATDGSTATQEAFAAMGMNADLMAQDIARGGEDARAAFDMIVDGLLDIRDPAKRAQTAVALFGTPVEDLSVAQIPEFLASLQGVGDGLGDVEGRADRLGDTLNDNAQTKITAFKRSIEQTLAKIVEMPGPIGTVAAAVAGMGQAAAPVAPALAIMATQGGLNLSKLSGLATSAFGAVKSGFGAMSKFVMANPWVALIAATVALVTLIVANWDKITEFLGKVWDWIKDAASAVGEWISNAFNTAVEFVKGLFLNFTPLGLIIKNFDKIKDLATGVKNWIIEKWNQTVDWIKGIPSKISSAVSGLFDKAKDLATEAWQWITDKFDAVVDFVSGLPGRITDAAAGMWDGIKNTFRNAINFLIDSWNNIDIKIGPFTVPDWIPVFGGKSWSTGDLVPDVPRLHDGGIVPGVPGTEVPVILEAGERVIPRDQAGGPLAGATFIIQGLPETVAQDVGRRVGMEVRWATG